MSADKKASADLAEVGDFGLELLAFEGWGAEEQTALDSLGVEETSVAQDPILGQDGSYADQFTNLSQRQQNLGPQRNEPCVSVATSDTSMVSNW
jgi:hypothetical protein